MEHCIVCALCTKDKVVGLYIALYGSGLIFFSLSSTCFLFSFFLCYVCMHFVSECRYCV